MIVYSRLRYKNEDAQVNEVKNQLEEIGEPVSLYDPRLLEDKQEGNNFYVLTRFFKELVPLKVTESAKVLQLMLRQVKVGHEVAGKEFKFFRAVLRNELAQAMHKAILEGKIITGDILTFHQPTVQLVTRGELHPEGQKDLANCRLFIEVSGTCDEVIYVWQPHNNSFIDSFPTLYSSNYTYISVYDMDQTGSTAHAVRNLLHIVRDRGIVVSMREIVKNRRLQTFIVLARLKRVVASLSNCMGISKICLSFDEILLEQNETSVSQLFTGFVAFFSGGLAEELQIAVDNKHVVSGDLMAFCNPVFDRLTKGPLNIQFPLDEENNIVVLKNQCSIKTKGFKVPSFEINADQPVLCTSSRGLPKDVVCLNKSDNLNCSNNFHILHFRHFADEVDALKRIAVKLEKYGKIKTLDSFDNQQTSGKHGSNGIVVLSYFLKLVTLLQTTGQSKRVIIFLKEIHTNGECGYVFKLVLHKTFAEKMCLALENNEIVRGDIIAFVNPLVFPNPRFTSQDLLAEEPYLLETGVLGQKEMIITCKLKESVKQVPRETSKGDFMLSKVTQGNPKCNRATQIKLGETSKGDLIQSQVTQANPKCNRATQIKLGETSNGDFIQSKITQANSKCNRATQIKLGETSKGDFIQSKITQANSKCNRATQIKLGETSKGDFIQSQVTQTNLKCNRAIQIKLGLDEDHKAASNQESIMNGLGKLTGNSSKRPVIENARITKKSALTDKIPENIIILDCRVGGGKQNAVRINASAKVSPNRKRQRPSAKKNNLEKMCNSAETITHVGSKTYEECVVLDSSKTTSVKDLTVNSRKRERSRNKNIEEQCKGKKRKNDDNISCQQVIEPVGSNQKGGNISCHQVIEPVGNNQKDVLTVFPMVVTKPPITTPFDFVSGYCSLSCHNMFVYSEITFSALLDPLCPTCLVELKLCLCFEMKALTNTGEHVIVLLVGRHAERFLGVTYKEFLKNNTARKTALELLDEKISHRSARGEHCKLKLSDVTVWKSVCRR